MVVLELMIVVLELMIVVLELMIVVSDLVIIVFTLTGLPLQSSVDPKMTSFASLLWNLLE